MLDYYEYSFRRFVVSKWAVSIMTSPRLSSRMSLWPSRVPSSKFLGGKETESLEGKESVSEKSQ